MMQNLAHALLRPINPAAIVILGALTVCWGAWVGIPLWDAFSTAQIFMALSDIASEAVWGCIAFATGAVMMNGAIKPSFFSLLAGSGIGFFFWIVISTLYFIGDWHNTGGLVSAFLALYCAYIFVNIAVNKPYR